MTSLKQLKKGVDLELRELRKVDYDVEILKRHLVEREIEHFSVRDILNTFFGAFIVGLTFMLKGLLIEIGTSLPWINVFLIVTTTLFILSMQVYFIGYTRVKNKHARKLGQFLVKRVITTYTVSLIVSFFLLYLFGMVRYLITLENVMRLGFILSMPCAIGAAIVNLIKRYVE